MKKLWLVAVACLAIGLIPGISTAQEEPAADQGESSISLELKDADIRDALDLLFKGKSDASYVVESGVSGRVSVNLRNVTWNMALRSILNAAGLDYRVEDNVYYISPKAPTTPSGQPTTNPYYPPASTPTTSTTGARAETVSTTGARPKIHLVTVRHADPGELAALFGGYSIGFSYGAGSIGSSAYGLGGVTGIGGGYGGIGGGYGGYGGGGYGGYGGVGGIGGGYGGIGGIGGGYGGIGGIGGGYGGIGGIGGGYGGYGGGGYGGYGGVGGIGGGYGGYGGGGYGGVGGIGGGYGGYGGGYGGYGGGSYGGYGGFRR